MNRKPIELHIVEGTKPEYKGVQPLPEKLRKRIPKAEWVDNPDGWDKERFINETADFLFEAYGIGNDQDRHTLGMLADQIETYIQCTKAMNEQGLIQENNGGSTVGANPHFSIRAKTMTIIIQLMNELGLTPRSRLAAQKASEDSPAAKFLKGPKG